MGKQEALVRVPERKVWRDAWKHDAELYCLMSTAPLHAFPRDTTPEFVVIGLLAL